MQVNQTMQAPERERGYMPLSGLLFMALFSVLLIIHCIENTSLIYSDVSWMNWVYFLKKGVYLVLIVKILFFSSYSRNELIALGVILVIAFASFVGSGDFGLFELFLLAIAAKKVEPRTIVSCFLVIKGLAIVFTLLFWKIGLIPTLYYRNGSGFYNTFGFCHRNVLGANIAILCLAWFFLRYQKLKLADVVLWVAIGFGMYRLIYSRSSLAVVLLVSVCVYLFRRMERMLLNIRNMRPVVLCAFLALLILSLICMVCYSESSTFWTALDRLFTTRLSSANYCYREFGLTLFGQTIPFVSSLQAQILQISKLILDNAYCRAILYYGMIPAAMFFFLYGKLLKHSFEKKDGALLISLLLLAVYGLSERYMMDAYYQFPFVAAFQYLGSVQMERTEKKRSRISFQLRKTE